MNTIPKQVVADRSIINHLQLLDSSKQLNSRATYALNCLVNSIGHNNANRQVNIEQLVKNIHIFINIAKLAQGCNHDQLLLLLSLFNSVLSYSNPLIKEDEALLLNVIGQANVSRGCMSEGLCQEIVSLCSKFRYPEQATQFLMRIMSDKMSSTQAINLIHSFKKQELHRSEPAQLIKLAAHYNTDQIILCRVLQSLHWQILNIVPAHPQKIDIAQSIIKFISTTLTNNINTIEIVSLCSLIYRELMDGKKILKTSAVSQNMDIFLRQSSMTMRARAYLPTTDSLISQFSNVLPVLQKNIDLQKNKELHCLLNYYSKSQFKWKQQLLESMKTNKGLMAKELLLRASEPFEALQQNRVVKISQKDQIAFSEWLPLQCFRTIEGILNKIKKSATPINALQIIRNIGKFPKQHPHYYEILLTVHQIFIEHKQFQSLSQIQKIIKEQLTSDFIISKIKEKGSLKNVDSNKQSKRFFICVPLVCSKNEIETVILNELCDIMNHETVKITLKFYVADFLFSKMILKPCKKFVSYLMRQIQNSICSSLMKTIISYVRPHSQMPNPAMIEWLSKYFSEQLQRLLQLFFSKLINPTLPEVAKLIFLLQKFNVFGSNWTHVYKWVLVSLEDVNQAYPDYTLDTLEIFQMVSQKVQINKIPSNDLQKFKKAIIKNWGKYNQDHLFAIDRIVNLFNEDSTFKFKQMPMQTPEQLIKSQQKYEKQNSCIQNQLLFHPTTRYLLNLIYNIFFGHIDRNSGIRLIINTFKTFNVDKSILTESEYAAKLRVNAMTQKNIIATFNCILWMFQDSEEQVQAQIDELVINFLYNSQSSSAYCLQNIKSKCLQYLSKVPHSINILKLQFQSYTCLGFYQKNWAIYLTDLISIVTDSKPKAIAQFKLHQIIKSMLIKLIALDNQAITNEYLDFIEACCFVDGEYQDVLVLMLPTLVKALRAERYDVGYRRSLVQFLIGTLLDFDQLIDPETTWFILRKYLTDAPIVELLLQSFQKQNSDKSNIDNKLLLRLVLTHNQNTIIQQKCKKLFNTYVPASSNQQKFMQVLTNGRYQKCQQLVDDISNPYAVNITLSEIKTLLDLKNDGNLKKLLRFLYDNPATQLKMYQCQNFILNSQYFSFVGETLNTLLLDVQPYKFQIAGNKAFFQTKQPEFIQELYKTLSAVLKNKNSCNSLKTLIVRLLKTNQEHLQIIMQFITQILKFFPQYEEMPVDNIKKYYNFCKEIVGEIQLMALKQESDEEIKRNYYKQIIYVFPFTLNTLNGVDSNKQEQNYQNIVRHYRAVQLSFSLIEKDINSFNYVIKILTNILKTSNSTANRQVFLPIFLKSHISFQDKVQLNFKQTQQNSAVQSLLLQILNNVNKFVEAQLNDSSNKVDPWVVMGFISFILLLIGQSVTVDVVTATLIAQITANLQNYGFNQKINELVKAAIDWLNSKISKMGKHQSFQKEQQKHSPTKTNINQNKQKAAIVSKETNYQSVKKMPSSVKAGKIQVEQQWPLPPKKQQLSKLQQAAKQEQGRKQIEQSYIKYKQIQERVTITQTTVTNKTTYIIVDEPKPMNNQIFLEPIQQPKQQTLDQEKFYRPPNSIPIKGPSQEERLANIESVKKILSAQFSIQSLKDHCRFIASLTDLSNLNANEYEQLVVSVESVIQTVNSHAFYVKKVSDSQTVFKLIKIYKTMFLNGNKKDSDSLILQILRLCWQMSQKKQKKLILFEEQNIIQFFKMIVKRSLNGCHIEEEIEILVGVLYNCRNNTQAYYKFGLISMVIQLINRDLSAVLVLEYLIKLDLSMYIINQIYQRGLFNKLILTFNCPVNQETKRILNLWIKLAGKVCINQSIQQRFRSKQLHIKVWQRVKDLTETQDRLNICYFFAYMCLKNQQITEWLIQNKVMDELLLCLRNQHLNEQLYLLFYHFCFNNPSSRDYCFRIKYHQHLITKLTQKWEQVKQGKQSIVVTKYFYKSLGQVMASKLHIPVFFKEEVVKKLIDIFNIKADSSIFQCLLDFISTLQNDSEFDQLKKQSFWDSLKIFEYKISSQATYSYLLQIFLIMIKKGRTRQFNQIEIRSKACLKAEYSINMEGKELALRFIIALSIRNKQNYLTQRCIRLLSSIMGFKVTKNQLQLTSQMLKIQGSTKNLQFLTFFSDNNIESLIIDSLDKFSDQQLELALNILTVISIQPVNSTKICQKSLSIVSKYLQNPKNGTIFRLTVGLLAAFSQIRDNMESFDVIEIDSILKSSVFLSKVKQNSAQKDFSELVQNLFRNNAIPQQKLKTIFQASSSFNIPLKMEKVQLSTADPSQKDAQLRQAVKSLRQGKKVKMYKSDGSISDLLLFISSDYLQINCGLKLSEVVKQKWRLPLNQIKQIIVYAGQQSPDFVNSYFQKNSGFFNKAPSYDCCISVLGKNNDFHICFFTAQQKSEWDMHISLVRDNARNLLAKLK